MWQKKGGQALHETERAAGVAGLALGAVAISSPPVAGAVNAFVNGMSGSGTASMFAGYQASGGGGGPLANWQGLFQAGAGASATATGSASITGVQGDLWGQAFAGEQGSVTADVGWSQLGGTGSVTELGGAEANGDVNGQFGLVLGHNRVSADMTLKALAMRLEADASALPEARLRPARTLTGTAGEVRITAFTHAGQPASGPLYQMTACLLAPSSDRDDADRERDLIYLTGTCTVDQVGTWEPAFVDAATSVRFG